jgi:hypothetical protein
MSDGVSGDDAVVQALAWPDGDFDFDAKAKLPPDETVKSTIPELINNAQGQESYAPERAEAESAEQPAAQMVEDSSRHVEPAGWHAVQPDMEVTPSVQTQEAAAAPEPSNHEPMDWGPVEPPQPRRQGKQRPQPQSGGEPVPVPAGSVMYDALKTSFVDFPRLITTLEKEGYTGYVRLVTEDASGLIFFRDGAALECVYDSRGEMQMGRQALSAFNQQVAQGQGALDVVNLSPELVNGVLQLTVAQPMYTELYASWVDMPALLNFLQQRRVTGTVSVRSGTSTGVIILTNGELTGAYTTESRDVSSDVNGVLSLCTDPEAMIEVKSGEAAPGSRLDVDEVVGRRANRQTAAPAANPVAPPPAPVAAPNPTPPANAAGRQESEETQTTVIRSQAPASPPAPAHNPTPVPAFNPAPTAVEAPAARDSGAFQTQPGRAAPTAVSSGAPDWEQIISDLQSMADESLGNRSRKVKDVLAAADRNQEGVMEAINQVPTISILFIDHSRLESLADEMRARVQSYLA